MPKIALDPIIADLARALAVRLDALVLQTAEVILGEIENYRSEEVHLEDLHTQVRHNLSCTLTHLADGQALDLTRSMETGRLRALQGMPLPEVLRAYRLGCMCFWEQLLKEADRVGPQAQTAMLNAATYIWEMKDSYCTAVTTAYRDTLAERMVETDRRRSALLAALIDGPPPGSDTVWEIARMLGFPYQGTFILVAAEAVVVGDPPLPGLDAKCRAVDVGSAWRAQPGYELGVLSCPRGQAVELALEAVRASATGRVGVSPAYDRLDQTSRALRYAHVALESLPPGIAAVRQLDDTPLTELVISNLENTQRAVRRILGGVLALPDEDRTTLLATAQAWLDARGSAAEAARALYCHPNTVRYRMHRLEEFLRGPLDNPKIVAELSMAVDAVGAFPTLLGHHPVPHHP
ncbi:helix-turn-helix domain-containing protein [Streptomyces sp. NPDC006733]|uniref:PucR family transcriptional regulator n=1 Tax=Streptomyces sp. NPDC006733 TaxID=3155460 RepID=UPI0033C03B50